MMAYSKKKLEEQALAAIEKHKFVFLDDVIAHLPCKRSTFYDKGLNKSAKILDAIEKNKIDLKTGLRKKMYHAEHPTAWAMLYKLIGTDEEYERLANAKQKFEHSGPEGQPISIVIKPPMPEEDDGDR